MKRYNYKQSAQYFIENNVEPLKNLLPLAKVHEFIDHANLVERTVNNDSYYRSFDYLEYQILLTSKERLNAYFLNKISSKRIFVEDLDQLEIKIKKIDSINNLQEFIKHFNIFENSIRRLEQSIKKPSFWDRIKNTYKYSFT